MVIGTTAAVGGTQECAVEAMEGFAVLRACELVGVPALELRAVSNHVEDDRGDWRVDEALDALSDAIGTAIAALDRAGL
jgi:futalosine hydrolase